jgi:hypothetical protein
LTTTTTRHPEVRAFLRAVPSIIAIVLTSHVPPPWRPLLCGLALLLAASFGWPVANAPEYRHRLQFLRNADGKLSRATYFMWFGAASILLMAVAGWFQYVVDPFLERGC